jgi:nitroreductase
MSEIARTRLSTIDAIEQRRAVKHYDASYKMTDDEIKNLVSLAAKTPSAFNIQHYRFVAVTDAQQKAALQVAAFGQEQVTQCSVLFVILADLKAWAHNPERYWRFAPAAVQTGVANAIKGFYEGREQVQRDEALLSAGMASQTLMLAAKSLGYDSCPMRGMDFDAVAKIINLPQDHVIAMMIAVGKGAEPAHPRTGPLELDELMVRDKFPD